MAAPVEIYVLDKTVRLLQPAGGFRTSLDSVMVAAACPARAGQAVADLGCGVGGAAFCLIRRVAGIAVTGFDNDPEYIDLARKNAGLNQPCRAEFELLDIKNLSSRKTLQDFDHVLCNPPFMESGLHTPSPDRLRAAALGNLNQETSLSNWIDGAYRILRPGGMLTLIHRADALDRVLQELGSRFGAVEIIPLWPRTGAAARRVIVRARKGRRDPARLLPGLALHEADDAYTAAADAVLRGAALAQD